MQKAPLFASLPKHIRAAKLKTNDLQYKKSPIFRKKKKTRFNVLIINDLQITAIYPNSLKYAVLPLLWLFEST